MKFRSIKRNITLLIGLLAALLLIAAFSFFSSRIDATNDDHYQQTVEMEKLFSDIILTEKYTLRDAERYEALHLNYADLESTCGSCHKTPDLSITQRRQHFFLELLQKVRSSEQLFDSIHSSLVELSNSVRYIHEHHAESLKKYLQSSQQTDKAMAKANARQVDIVNAAVMIQTDLNDIIHSFFELRISGKPKNQFLEQQFSSLLEEFYYSINRFEQLTSDKQDKALVDELLLKEKYFEDSFSSLINFAYAKEKLEQQLNANRQEMLRLLADKRSIIQKRHKTISKVNGILQYLSFFATLAVIVWTIMNGRLIMAKARRIVYETQNIQNDLRYKIDIDNNVVDEFRVVYTALNSMAGKINGQLIELQKAHDELEERVMERTAELQTSNANLQLEIKERQEAEKQIELQKIELAKKNLELSAIYQVSSKIARTIEMPKLFFEIINAVLDIDTFQTVREGGIYLVDINRMKLVACLGQKEMMSHLNSYENIEECFCGEAVTSGEIIISQNCFDEKGNFTHQVGDNRLKEKLVVPLKVKGGVAAVLFLRIPPDSSDTYIDKIHLLTVIGNQIGIAVENARLYEETKYLALYDPLTGVANRRLMDITLEKLFSAVKRYGHPLSVIMADIDHFKHYNDTFGHHAGDKILADVASLIKGEIRDADIASRYGGEEFLIILPETNKKSAMILAERIRKKVEARTQVTISQGVAAFSENMTIKENLVNKADEALYHAKQYGRNRVEC